jgi:ubiquinone/menaquinone biosynthesis C-methylase UbiE
MTNHCFTKKSSAPTPSQDHKYSLKSILNPQKLKKGKTRWDQYARALAKINTQALSRPMLDFGCGVGYFVLEGLQRKMDIWGVDRSLGKLVRYEKLLRHTSSSRAWKNRYVIAGGADLPFRSNHFAAVSSWYVFEHIEAPGNVIRELVRITQPEGIIVIRAQDARNFWEGHCKIPWIPFLSDRLARIWIEEFGKSPELRKGVYDITQPQIAYILEALDCRVVRQAPPPRTLIANHSMLNEEEKVRRTARIIKKKFENGEWLPQPENLFIWAQKK